MSFGVGDLLVPTIFTHLFDGVKHPNKGLQGLFDSITIVLSTPCKCRPHPRISLVFSDALAVLVAGLVALVLNLILPQEDVDDDDDDVVEVADDVEAHPHSKEKEASEPAPA